MAVGTTTAIIGGLGVAKSIYDGVNAKQKQKKHQAELDNYQRQELTNVYENMPISTIGSDIMRDDAARGVATAMRSVQQGGVRSIIGATQSVVNENNNTTQQTRQYLDDQIQKREYAIAGDNARLREMQEQREYGDLAGIGNNINTAKHDFDTALSSGVNSLMYLGSNLESKNKTTSPRESVSTLSKNLTPAKGISTTLTGQSMPKTILERAQMGGTLDDYHAEQGDDLFINKRKKSFYNTI